MGPEILIVGDRVHRGELIPRVQDLGYTVVPVRERDLLQRVGRSPTPAAVIVCLGAPDTAGLVKSLRRTREGSTVPVLVVGKLDGDGLADVLELGADRFLETPVDGLELEEALAELAGPAETAPRPRPRPKGPTHEDPALSQIHETLEILAARLETGEEPEADGIDLDALGLDAVPNVDVEHAPEGDFDLPRAAGRLPDPAAAPRGRPDGPTLQLPRGRHESFPTREVDAPLRRDAPSERTAPVATAAREDVRRDKSRWREPEAEPVREVTARLPSARPLAREGVGAERRGAERGDWDREGAGAERRGSERVREGTGSGGAERRGAERGDGEGTGAGREREGAERRGSERVREGMGAGREREGMERRGAGSGREREGMGAGREREGMERRGAGSGRELGGTGSGREREGTDSVREREGTGPVREREGAERRGVGSGRELGGTGAGREGVVLDRRGAGSERVREGTGSGREREGTGSGREREGTGSERPGLGRGFVVREREGTGPESQGERAEPEVERRGAWAWDRSAGARREDAPRRAVEPGGARGDAARQEPEVERRGSWAWDRGPRREDGRGEADGGVPREEAESRASWDRGGRTRGRGEELETGEGRVASERRGDGERRGAAELREAGATRDGGRGRSRLVDEESEGRTEDEASARRGSEDSTARISARELSLRLREESRLAREGSVAGREATEPERRTQRSRSEETGAQRSSRESTEPERRTQRSRSEETGAQRSRSEETGEQRSSREETEPERRTQRSRSEETRAQRSSREETELGRRSWRGEETEPGRRSSRGETAQRGSRSEETGAQRGSRSEETGAQRSRDEEEERSSREETELGRRSRDEAGERSSRWAPRDRFGARVEVARDEVTTRIPARPDVREEEARGSLAPLGSPTASGEDEAAEVLTRLRRERFTGCLQARGASGPERRLWWSEGQVVGGESEAAGESVIGRLRARGLLDARDFAVVARWGGGDPRRDLERLVQGRFLKPQEVQEALREPVRRLVEAIVEAGPIAWALVTESRPPVSVELGVPLAALIAGGVRRGLSVERLRALVVDERRPRLPALHGPPELNFAVPESLAAELRWPGLVGVVERFDGQTSVGLLVAEAVAEESEIRAAVYVLGLLGHLAPEVEDEAADLVALDRRRVRERLRLARESDYFTLLGLERGAKRAEVLRAYADLSATFSEGLEPASREELAGELEELRAALEEARDVLTDEALHSAYLARVGEP